MKFRIRPPPVGNFCYQLDRKDLSDDAKIALLRKVLRRTRVDTDPLFTDDMDDDDDGEEEEEETKKVMGDKKGDQGIAKRHHRRPLLKASRYARCQESEKNPLISLEKHPRTRNPLWFDDADMRIQLNNVAIILLENTAVINFTACRVPTLISKKKKNRA
nr:uncharacterized protein LOC127347191 [Lolium perenne]